MKNIRSYLWAFFLLLIWQHVFAQDKVTKEQGVYEFVLTDISGSLKAAEDSLKTGLEVAGLKYLGGFETRMEEACDFKARVLVFEDSDYSAELMKINNLTAPFAAQLRLNLFQDENGLNLSMVNPLNINRTILLDDDKYVAFTLRFKNKWRGLIEESLPGKSSSRQYGQSRDEGYIGRTMGVMAGGPFDEKIETLVHKDGISLDEAALKLGNRLSRAGDKWGLEEKYVQHLDDKTVVFGISGLHMESRSFDIVKSGADDSREDFKCPGLAHAAAYPIELVVVAREGGIDVRLVDAMYRMKMYFEDAGMMAFARNMTMPGSLKSEIEDMVKDALK